MSSLLFTSSSAVNEDTVGALQSFYIQDGGVLSAALDTASSGGNGPANALAMTTGQVSVMNVIRPVLVISQN